VVAHFARRVVTGIANEFRTSKVMFCCLVRARTLDAAHPRMLTADGGCSCRFHHGERRVADAGAGAGAGVAAGAGSSTVVANRDVNAAVLGLLHLSRLGRGLGRHPSLRARRA
jgi:hypothetical protein